MASRRGVPKHRKCRSLRAKGVIPKMSRFANAIVVLIFSVLAPTISMAQDQAAQQPKPIALSSSILNRLPPDYRDEAKSLLTEPEDIQQSWLKLSDEDLAAGVIYDLGRKDEASDFLLTELEKEHSASLRWAIISATRDYWTSHAQAEATVEHHAAADPDASVAIQTLELLRSTRMAELGKLLQARLGTAKNDGDAAALAKLGPEEQLWFSLEHRIMLPAFLQVPPPLFSVEPPDKSIRALAFGDFGTGSMAQEQTAAAMRDYHKEHPFDFGLTLGDNFYTYGMVSPSDPRWQTQWEQLYGPLGIKFYATLGNHDWASADSPAAEILYTEKSPNWRLPAPYYTFTAGPVQFFAFDTVEVNEEELEWLDSELSKSAARWKVVFGHYHIFSATRGDNKVLIERLLPVLEKNHVDIYLNGHDHNLQELKPEGGVHFFVSGGGGAGLYDLNPYDRSVYKQKVNGFTVLEADQDHFKVSFIGTDGKELHASTLTK
jgi:tartrate-resistant acid phosphatase type 5